MGVSRITPRGHGKIEKMEALTGHASVADACATVAWTQLSSIVELGKGPEKGLEMFDRASEIVDTYDELGRFAGTKERGAVHRDGDWHRCFHCVIVSGDRDNRRLVLQRRALDLVDYPGLIDVSVAGHLRTGEVVNHAATREIAEELGVLVPFESLRPLGEYPLIVRTSGLWARELTDVFVVRDDRSPDAYNYDPTEVGSIVAVKLSHVVQLWRGEREHALATEYTTVGSFEFGAALSDFVNEVPDYWPWLADALSDEFSRTGM
jgi:isopentenyldiphosphate isomerase